MSNKSQGRHSASCPEGTWEKYWSENRKLSAWDDLSEIVYRTLKRELGYLHNRNIMEVGSGTGRISARLCEEGANVTLLDTSQTALKISERIFREKGLKATFIEGSALNIPLEDETYDAVWSSGLLEHFKKEDQRQIVNEMKRVERVGGAMVNLVPNRHAPIYYYCKNIAERIDRWPFGYEEPLTEEELLGLTHNSIYSVGYYYQLTFLGLIPFGGIVYIPLRYLSRAIRGKKYYKDIGKRGYLLVGVSTK